jgi:hypothetical protein
MSNENDRTQGQTQVKSRSVWRSANGQTEIFIPVGEQTPAKDWHEIKVTKALQMERAKKAVKVACCAGSGGLALYGIGLLIVTHWLVITVGALSVGVVALSCKLFVDARYKNRFAVKDNYNTSQTATKTSGQTIIHNHYYN